MLLKEKVRWRVSERLPNPLEVDYWIDINANRFGKIIKFYNNNLGIWEPIGGEDTTTIDKVYEVLDQLTLYADTLHELSKTYTDSTVALALKEVKDYTVSSINELKEIIDTLVIDKFNEFREEIKQELQEYNRNQNRIMEKIDYDNLTAYELNVIYFVYPEIEYIVVPKPVDREIPFDGFLHKILSTVAYDVIGEGGSEPGVYTFIIKLKFGYKWNDGTRDELTVTYIIKNTDEPSGAWVFGGRFPITFGNGHGPVVSEWKFGNTFPVVFGIKNSSTEWLYGDLFPIEF